MIGLLANPIAETWSGGRLLRNRLLQLGLCYWRTKSLATAAAIYRTGLTHLTMRVA